MSELEHLRNFAVAAQRGGFNVPIFKLDGNTGEFRRVGKNNTGLMNGQKLASDPADTMTGWQRFRDNRPIYILGRVADGYQPPEREELGPADPNKKDPWQRIDLLPFWDPESREVLLFSAASQGSRDAVASLIGAYADNLAAHPEDRDKVPLIELATDSYENTHGKQIFIAIFEVIDWIERPTAVRRILPPPVRVLELAAVPTVPATPPSDPTLAKSDQRAPSVAKAKPKKSAEGRAPAPDMDDEIPF
jgi:hypothetical protein